MAAAPPRTLQAGLRVLRAASQVRRASSGPSRRPSSGCWRSPPDRSGGADRHPAGGGGRPGEPLDLRAARLAPGLDDLTLVQFARSVGDVATGDLGLLIGTGRPVAGELARVFPARPEMATRGILIGGALGVQMGVFAAARQQASVDQALRVVGRAGYAIPAFWLGLVGLVVFYARLRWSAGRGGSTSSWTASCRCARAFCWLTA